MPADNEAARIELPVAVQAWRARLQYFRAHPQEIDNLLRMPIQLVLQTTDSDSHARQDTAPAPASR